MKELQHKGKVLMPLYKQETIYTSRFWVGDPKAIFHERNGYSWIDFALACNLFRDDGRTAGYYTYEGAEICVLKVPNFRSFSYPRVIDSATMETYYIDSGLICCIPDYMVRPQISMDHHDGHFHMLGYDYTMYIHDDAIILDEIKIIVEDDSFLDINRSEKYDFEDDNFIPTFVED